MRRFVWVRFRPQEVHQGVAGDGLAGVGDEIGAQLAQRAATADRQPLTAAVQGEAAEEGGEEWRLVGRVGHVGWGEGDDGGWFALEHQSLKDGDLRSQGVELREDAGLGRLSCAAL